MTIKSSKLRNIVLPYRRLLITCVLVIGMAPLRSQPIPNTPVFLTNDELQPIYRIDGDLHLHAILNTLGQVLEPQMPAAVNAGMDLHWEF